MTGGRSAEGLIAITASAVGDDAFRFAAIEHYVEFIDAALATADTHGLAAAVIPPQARLPLWDGLPLLGSIVADPTADDERLPYLRARALPLVTVGRDPGHPYGGLTVENDAREGTIAILDHLMAMGADRVGLIAWAEQSWFAIESMSAYGHWCADHRVDPVVEIAPDGDEDGMDPKRIATCRFLTRPDRPRAVYCLCEAIAFDLLNEAATRGVRVPDDLLVASVGDHGLSRSSQPPLTTLEMDPHGLGFRAVEMLLHALRTPGLEDRTVIVGTTVIPRASSAGHDRAIG